MYNLAKELQLFMWSGREFPWRMDLTEGADFSNAVWKKGTVQSVMEDILETLRVFSAGQEGIVTQ